MAEEVAALNIRLEATAARFENEMRRATRTLDRQAGRMERRASSLDRRLSAVGARFGKQLLAGAGAFLTVQGFRRLSGAIQGTVDKLDDIGKTADKLGLTTDALQELRVAAELSGVATKTFDMAFQRFTRRAGEAAQGTGEAKDALKTLGVTLDDLRTRSPEQLFNQVADAIANVEDPAERLRLAFKLFDSEGAALVNALTGGSAALEEMRAQARELGVVFDESLIRRAEGVKDELTLMNRQIEASTTVMLAELAPALRDITGFLADVAWAAGLAWRGMRRLAGVQLDAIEVPKLTRDLEEAEQALSDFDNQFRKSMDMAGGNLNEDQLNAALERMANRRGELVGEIEDIQARLAKALSTTAEDVAPPELPTRPPLDLGGSSGGGGRGGGRADAAERTNEFVEVLELMEREASALERRIAVMGMNTRAEAEFLAETMALNLARERGIELTDKQRETIRIFASDIGNLAEMEEELRAKTEDRARAQQEAEQRARDTARSIEQIGGAMLGAIQQADSFEDALKRVALQLANIALQGLSQPGGGILGSLIPALAGAAGAAAGGGSGFNFATNTGGLYAKGGAFSGGRELTAFARGGIVHRPTVFPMAEGAGLMGEAGPEAIMPLRRGPGGKLGVEASGGGNVYQIDARGATAESIAELKRALFEAVGPGKIERRALNHVVEQRRRRPDLFK